MPQKNNHQCSFTGCFLTLFGLPFLCVGLGTTVWYFYSWILFCQAQQWPEVPCVIESVSLVGNGDTHETKAAYNYRFQGKTYRSEQVSFFSGSDNIGSFHRDVYRELNKYKVSQAEFNDQDAGTKTFRCYVNPNNPEKVILYRNYRWQLQIFKMPFSILFTSFGAAFVIGNLIAGRNSKRRFERQESFPSEPWKHSLDWTEHGLIDARSRSQPVLFAFTIFTGCLLIPHLHALLVTQPFIRDPNAWVAFVPIVIWLLPAWFSLRRLRHLHKVGECHLRPINPLTPRGEMWKADITCHTARLPELPARIRLSCRKTISHSNKKESQTEIVWQESFDISPMQIRSSPPGTIPISFHLPRDAPASSLSHDEQIHYEWNLDFRIPHSPIRAKFNVPMHFSKGTPTQPSTHSLQSKSIGDATDQKLIDLLKHAHIHLHCDAHDKPIFLHCTQRRMLPAGLFLLLFSLIWTTIAIVLIKTDGPRMFRILWSISSGILWLVIPLIVLHQRRVEFQEEKLQITHQWGPFHRKIVLDRKAIENFTVSLHNNDVQAVMKNGKKYTAVDALTKSLLAESTAKRLKTWL